MEASNFIIQKEFKVFVGYYKQNKQLSLEQEKIITSLFQRQNWVQQNLASVKEFCAQLQNDDHPTAQTWRLRSFLCKIHPEFFSTITAKLGDWQANIQFNDQNGEFFKSLSNSNFKEGQEKEIDLGDAQCATDFLQYLVTHQVSLNDSNYIEMFELAKMYGVNELLKDCIKYIIKIRDQSAHILILELIHESIVSELRDDELLFAFLDCIRLHYNEIKKGKYSEDFKQLLFMVKQCQKYEVSFRFIQGLKCLSLGYFNKEIGSPSYRRPTDPKIYDLILQIHQKFPVQGLEFLHAKVLDSTNLEHFAASIPELKYLYILGSELLTSIPQEWKNLDRCICAFCPRLPTKEVSTIKDLQFEGEVSSNQDETKEFIFLGEKLELLNFISSIIVAQNAKKIKIGAGDPMIIAPAVEEIECLGPLSPGILSQAKFISMRSLIGDVDAPQAIDFYLSDSTVKSVKAVKAKTINIVNCNQLKEIIAPEAETIYLYKCDALTSISAPKAKKIQIFDCRDLNILNAPEAEVVEFKNCPSMESFVSLKVKFLTVSDCKSFFKIEVFIADKIKLTNCPEIKALDVPNVADWEIERCPIKYLDAREARRIFVKDCKDLIKVLASGDKLLYFNMELLNLISKFESIEWKRIFDLNQQINECKHRIANEEKKGTLLESVEKATGIKWEKHQGLNFRSAPLGSRKEAKRLTEVMSEVDPSADWNFGHNYDPYNITKDCKYWVVCNQEKLNESYAAKGYIKDLKKIEFLSKEVERLRDLLQTTNELRIESLDTD